MNSSNSIILQLCLLCGVDFWRFIHSCVPSMQPQKSNGRKSYLNKKISARGRYFFFIQRLPKFLVITDQIGFSHANP